MSENKAETILKNLPNSKSIKKYLPEELRHELTGQEILETRKDEKGLTVYVKAKETIGSPIIGEYNVGYNEDGSVGSIQKRYYNVKGEPSQWTVVYGKKKKFKFTSYGESYVLEAKHEDAWSNVAAKYVHLPAVSVDLDGDRDTRTPHVEIRDFKGRLVCVQQKNGQVRTYAYLKDLLAVTDYTVTELTKRQNSINPAVTEYHMTQRSVHYEYGNQDDNSINATPPKYACETVNGVLVKEYIVEFDAVGSFIHVIDYENRDEYWVGRNIEFDYPKQDEGYIHPSSMCEPYGMKFHDRDEYTAYRKDKINELRVENKAREMLRSMYGHMGHFMG